MKNVFFTLCLGLMGFMSAQAQNNISIDQQGLDNAVSIESLEGSAGNTLLIEQIGDRNSLEALLIQQNDLLYQAKQQGNDNYAKVEAVWGTANKQISLEQVGNANQAYQLALLDDIDFQLSQQGDNNDALQTGDGLNTAVIYQNGNGNSATQSLSFGPIEAYVMQVGNLNTYQLAAYNANSRIVGLQIGDNNTISHYMDNIGLNAAFQYGNGNEVRMEGQGANVNSVALQLGDRNQAIQQAGYGYINLGLAQYGNDNYALQSVGNSGGELQTVQLGHLNTSDERISDGPPDIEVVGRSYQEGQENQLSTQVLGPGYLYEIEQLGMGNTVDLYAEVYLAEELVEAHIAQHGNYNSAIIEQYSGQINLLQSGNNNQFSLIQQ